MTIRVLLIFILLFLFSFSLYSQSETEDVVYLKNGGVVRGIITEFISDKNLKIQTRDGKISDYEFKEIKMIAKEQIPVTSSPVSKGNQTGDIQYNKPGYSHMAKIGPFGLSAYSLHIVNGYRFNPYFILGLGLGLDTYRGLGKNEDLNPSTVNQGPGSSASKDYFLPIYIDFRYNINKKKTTFFTFINLGYSIYLGGNRNDNLPSDTSYAYNYMGKPLAGGIFMATGAGFKTFVSSEVALFFELGLRLQSYEAIQYSVSYSSNYYYYGGSNTNTYTYTSGRAIGVSALPMINFGIAF
jgi:hypothetical protein